MDTRNTIYFKKWDVVGNVNYASGNNFEHQYQTNIQAPMIEGNSVYKSYNDSKVLDSPFVFYIPVYSNMPASTSLPKTGNPNNYLSSLNINGSSVSSFDGGVTNYNYYVKSNVESITISATTVNSNARVSGTGYVSLTSDNTSHNIVVTAQNGDTRTYTINIIREPKPVTPTSGKVTVESVLNNAGIKNNSNYLMGFSVGSNINQIINKIGSNATVTIKDLSGKVITSDTIKTGYSVTIKTKDYEKTLKTVLYGDVNGDGKISAVDYVFIKNYIMKKTSLSGANLEAADVDKNKTISAVDYVRVKNNIMGSYVIPQ